MHKKDEHMEFEKEAAFLASLPSNMPYRVPDQYFDDLQSRINQAVFLADLGQKENQGFQVPKHYFESLGEQIESRIALDELLAQSKTPGFKTPVNYFDQLQTEILSKTTGAVSKPKIFRLWQSEVMKYVSAACFIVLAASGLYLKQQNQVQRMAQTELADDSMLYDIDESVIFEHLEETQTANTTPASQTEMENYILDNFSSNELSNNL